MKFTKELLLEKLNSDDQILNEITGTSRWSIQYRLVFRHEDKLYESHYQTGATENQDESPWEYDGSEIECSEVKRVEKIAIFYERLPK